MMKTYAYKWNPNYGVVTNNLKQMDGVRTRQTGRASSTQEKRTGNGYNALAIRAPRYFEISTADNPEMERYLNQTLNQIWLEVKNVTEIRASKSIQSIITREFKNFAKDERTVAQFVTDLEQTLRSKLSESTLLFILQQIKSVFQERAQKATRQWEEQRITYLLHDVPLIEAVATPGQTDAIFFTDVAQQFGNEMLLATFHNERRSGEELAMYSLANTIGLTPIKLVDKAGNPVPFEGGDIRKGKGDSYFFGYGYRTQKETIRSVERAMGVEVISAKNLHFDVYHLDCWFNPLDGEHALVWPGEEDKPTASSEEINKIIAQFGSENILFLSQKETLAFATNSIVIDKKIFVNHGSFSRRTMQQLTSWGYAIVETEYDAMHDSGGSIRCSANELNLPDPIRKKMLFTQIKEVISRKEELFQQGVNPKRIAALEVKFKMLLNAELVQQRLALQIKASEAEDALSLSRNLENGFVALFPYREA